MALKPVLGLYVTIHTTQKDERPLIDTHKLINMKVATDSLGPKPKELNC